MKFIIPILFLSISLNTVQLIAQYDAGAVIYTHTSNNNLTSVLKNYIVDDFDGDFNKDVIVIKGKIANSFSQLTWYKGDGSGNFFLQENLLNVDYYQKENEIFYEDMNGDNIKDIIFQNSVTGFTILLTDGQGTITSIINNEVTSNYLGVDLKEVSDVDGDGDMDCIFLEKIQCDWFRTDNCYGYCLVGYNNGNASIFNYSYIDNEEPKIFLQIETADVDDDGNLEVICNGLDANDAPFINVYQKLNTNEFIVESEISLSNFTNVYIQDIDNDGGNELLVENATVMDCGDDIHPGICPDGSYQFSILDYHIQNQTFFTLENYNSWLHGYSLPVFFSNYDRLFNKIFYIQFAHQNTDNNLDILSVNVPQGKLHWYYGDGNGGFNNGQVVNFNSQYSSISPALRVVDIDNDTDLDIFVLLNDNTSSTLTIIKNLTLTPSCATVLDLGSTSLTDGIYQAGTTLISSGNVASVNNNVVLKAGENIRLESGFTAPANSTVKVRISSCN